MAKSRYFILFRMGGKIVAAEAPFQNTEEWPASLSLNGAKYFPLSDGDTFFFWDELRNEDGSTVGYTFLLPESPIFKCSSFVRTSNNVVLDGEEAFVLLQPCEEPAWECVQGFGSEVYCNKKDATDCILYMEDFSENAIAFPLQELA